MGWTYDTVLKQTAALSKSNRPRVEAFLKAEFGANRLKPGSGYNYVRVLGRLDAFLKGRPLNRVKGSDILAWVEAMRKEGLEETNFPLFKSLLGKFLRSDGNGVRKQLAPDVEAALHHRANGKRLPADTMVSRDDVLAAAGAARNQRDRALLLALYESAFRAGEMVALNVGSVEFDSAAGVEVTIPEEDGGVKTGGRSVWLFDAAPDLKAWLNLHPRRADPRAPLFPRLGGWGKRKNGEGRIDINSMNRVVKSLFDAAGVKKEVWPHLLRHSRLTELSAQISESDLRIYAGWTAGSDMPAVYVHRTSADLKKKLKRLKGVATEDEKAKEDRNPLAPLKCPDLTCGAVNPAGFTFCGRCGGALTAEAARRLKEKKAELQDLGTGAVKRGGLTEESMVAEMEARLLAAKAKAEKNLGLA